MTARQRVFSYAPRPGVQIVENGVEFCVYAGHATAVDLCIFDAPTTPDSNHRTSGERRIACTDVGGGLWAAYVEGAGAGTRYAYRAHGPWEPHEGLRYNPNKLLVDPYAKGLDGQVQWSPAVFGHTVGDDFTGDAGVQDERDSADRMPRSVVIDDSFDWGDDTPPRTLMRDSVIYEMHVRGFTHELGELPPELRGTYAGLAHPAAIAKLTALGVTAVELLPVHAFTHEPHLVKLGLTNYWGYNTLGYFAPYADYAHADEPQGVVNEFKTMVKALHAAGLEVILDVVYNHTAEQAGHEGATLSLRGFDNRAYYRLDEAGQDIDVTGCGNSVDVRHPAAMRLILDSLRYWVSEMHVDGFRFDLGVTLGRGPGDDFNPNEAFLMALRTDPILSGVKLIAEPWDIGMHGWRTGQFPPPFSEWNDRFRNTVRDFWLTDVARDERGERGNGVGDLATRIAGSRDIFASPFRRPEASINLITAHDGWPLADLVSYETKHNEANGEDNRDGTNDNRSWNHGVEGATDDPQVRARRLRSMRNMLGTLIFSAGVPMLTAGDEFARTQRGNNNAYCQDSPISWVSWQHDEDQRALTDTVGYLLELRSQLPVLRRTEFFDPSNAAAGASLLWFDHRGEPMSQKSWSDPRQRSLQAYFDGSASGSGSVLLVLNGSAGERSITLPAPDAVSVWNLRWDSTLAWPTDEPGRQIRAGESISVAGPSMLVLTPQPVH